MRWLNGTAAAGDILKDAAQLIVLGDREFDINAQFARVPSRGGTDRPRGAGS